MATVSAVGSLVIGCHVPAISSHHPALLSVLMLLAIPISLVKVRFPKTPSNVTMGHVLNYIALLTLGTGAAVLVGAAGGWSQCTFQRGSRNALHRTWFSIAAIALAMQCSGTLYVLLGGKRGAWEASTDLVPFAAATTTFFLLNSGLVAAAIGLTTNRSLGRLWYDTFLSTWPGYLLGGTVAAASVFAVQHGTVWLVFFLGIPFALSFHSLRAYLERVDEAATDALTGLPNRRHAMAHATRELDRAKRDGAELTILLADLDGFKAINDRYGHRAGDRALRHVAWLLQASMHSHDVCARYGGDEFLVVMSDSSAARGTARARQLQTIVSALAIQIAPNTEASMRFSVGTATYPVDGTDLESLLDTADARMYQDKIAPLPVDPDARHAYRA